MGFLELIDKFSVLVNFVGVILIASGFYWTTKANFKRIDAEIDDMKSDNKIRWSEYAKKQEVDAECNNEILSKLGTIGVDIGAIKTDVDWLKKK